MALPVTDDTQIRVALVEDHPSSAEGLLMRFISEGFAVIANVATPAQLEGLRPDVVVCDLMMPSMSAQFTSAG